MYVALSDLQALVPGPFISEALDDGESITPSEVWDSVASAVGKEIDGILGGRYAVPFVPPVPAVVTRAAVVLAGETLYLRRGKTDNPFTEGAKAVRDQLNKIGFGEQPLAPIVQRAQPTAILAPAGATSSYNRVIA